MTTLLFPPPVADATAPCFDYHTHHVRCGHAQGTLRDYVQAALALDLSELGVSDHGPAYFLPGDHPLPGTQMARSELPRYVAEARGLQSEYAGRIALKVGLEADFVEGREDDLAELLDAQPFDYVLGSVHYVNGRHIYDQSRWGGENAEVTYAAYYALIAQMAASGLFDVLSHLTAIEAYGPPLPDELSDRLYPPVVEAVRASGCVVEINTSGWRKMGPERGPFPNRKMLGMLALAGVPITFGSDAHRPDEVGYARAQAAQLLADIGLDIADAQPMTVRRGPLLAVLTRTHSTHL
jgi:histidinol-phosphatase (PHP family)